MNLKAVVLAGGLGTRLRSVTGGLPKPMAPIRSRPFLEYVLDSLVAEQFDQAVLSIGYRGDVIESHFGCSYRSLRLTYHREIDPLGTGGALLQSLRHLTSEHIFVLNGDTFLQLRFHDMLAFHLRHNAAVSIAATSVEDSSRYGKLQIGRHEDLIAFTEKGTDGPGVINAGAYLLRKDIFSGFDLPAVFSFETDFLQVHHHRFRTKVYRTQGEFIDIGIPEDYARAQSAQLGGLSPAQRNP